MDFFKACYSAMVIFASKSSSMRFWITVIVTIVYILFSLTICAEYAIRAYFHYINKTAISFTTVDVALLGLFIGAMSTILAFYFYKQRTPIPEPPIIGKEPTDEVPKM